MSDKEFLARLNAFLGGVQWRTGVACPVFLKVDGSINRDKTLQLVVFSDIDRDTRKALLKEETEPCQR